MNNIIDVIKVTLSMDNSKVFVKIMEGFCWDGSFVCTSEGEVIEESESLDTLGFDTYEKCIDSITKWSISAFSKVALRDVCIQSLVMDVGLHLGDVRKQIDLIMDCFQNITSTVRMGAIFTEQSVDLVI